VTPPPVTIEEFKTRFDRHFTFGETKDKVRDQDITLALNEATLIYNADLWEDVTEGKIAFLLAAAHCLDLNVQAAGGLSAINYGRGIQNKGGGVIQSKSVGSVSVNFAIPNFVTESPILSQLAETGFGKQYLQMFLARRVGHAECVKGSNDTGVGIEV